MRAEAISSGFTSITILARAKILTWSFNRDGAADLKIDSQMFKLRPLLFPCDDPLAACDDQLGVDEPFMLRNITARLINLALDKFLPTSCHFCLGFLCSLLDVCLKLSDHFTPGLWNFDLELSNDFFTTLCTLVTSLKELTFSLFDISEGCLKDSLALSFKFWWSHSAEPLRNLLLDLLQVLDIVKHFSSGLAHVAIACAQLRLRF